MCFFAKKVWIFKKDPPEDVAKTGLAKIEGKEERDPPECVGSVGLDIELRRRGRLRRGEERSGTGGRGE